MPIRQADLFKYLSTSEWYVNANIKFNSGDGRFTALAVRHYSYHILETGEGHIEQEPHY
jgi:hypothetical protein